MAKATAKRAQKKRIVEMLKTGLIDRSEAQIVIDRYREEPDKSREEFWEKYFPGKSKLALSFVRPFYDWHPIARRPLPDLEERVKKAIYWHRVDTVTFESMHFYRTLGVSLSLHNGSVYSYQENHAVYHSLDQFFKIKGYHSGSVASPVIAGQLSMILRCALNHAVLGRLEQAEKLRGLLNLWERGNFPMGYGSGKHIGTVSVLVAD